MNNIFLAGFLKAAQGEETEISRPEQEGKETIVTCLSSCTYSQNPEKRCMLEGMSLSMDENVGTFTCGQFSPVQQLQGAPVAPEAQPEQNTKQPGLPGTPIQ